MILVNKTTIDKPHNKNQGKGVYIAEIGSLSSSDK